MKKLIFSTLFSLCFASCQTPSRWTASHMQANDPSFRSSRLTYHCQDRINEINVEFLKTRSSLHCYLYVHSDAIPPYKGALQEARVQLLIESTQHTIIAMRHAGGQRLLLPDSAGSLILSALDKGTPVFIKLDGYAVKLDPENFKEQFASMQTSSLFTLADALKMISNF